MKKLKKLEKQWNNESNDGAVMFDFNSVGILYFVVSFMTSI